jgi:hypothetical protein
MLPWSRFSSSRDEPSKLMKYGSSSSSESPCEVGGKRAKIWGSDADDGCVEYLEGDVGVDPTPPVLSLAEDEGTGRY